MYLSWLYQKLTEGLPVVFGRFADLTVFLFDCVLADWDSELTGLPLTSTAAWENSCDHSPGS